MSSVSFVWLEITGRCQLSCSHCYADSGPSGTHGTMTAADWRRVIDQATALGVGTVQFIGGEPTLHPELPTLVDHALAAGVEVEVFSNLVHVSPRLWETFGRSGVRLACSYYSDRAAEHAAVTGTAASYARTRANIAEAVRRAIPLRVGVVDLGGGQRAQQAIAELRALGVDEVGYDRLRQVGRGVRDQTAGVEQLCGHCASDVLAISPSGAVWPCVFSRWLPVGNVHEAPLADILAGPAVTQVRDELTATFAAREASPKRCVPHMCNPQCGPNCGPACQPQGKRQPCKPIGGCQPNYTRPGCPPVKKR
jgi:sulfatase maturation enzyme AslB (radical SAM superfamily)